MAYNRKVDVGFRRNTSFSLCREAMEELHAIADAENRSRSGVVENLLLRERQKREARKEEDGSDQR